MDKGQETSVGRGNQLFLIKWIQTGPALFFECILQSCELESWMVYQCFVVQCFVSAEAKKQIPNHFLNIYFADEDVFSWLFFGRWRTPTSQRGRHCLLSLSRFGVLGTKPYCSRHWPTGCDKFDKKRSQDSGLHTSVKFYQLKAMYIMYVYYNVIMYIIYVVQVYFLLHNCRQVGSRVPKAVARFGGLFRRLAGGVPWKMLSHVAQFRSSEWFHWVPIEFWSFEALAKSEGAMEGPLIVAGVESMGLRS